HGFKVRCPSCGAVVRLQVPQQAAAHVAPPPAYNDGTPPPAAVPESFDLPPPELFSSLEPTPAPQPAAPPEPSAPAESPLVFVEMQPLTPVPQRPRSWKG